MKSRVSTITEVLKKWEKRDRYLEKLEKIRIKERKLNTYHNRILNIPYKRVMLNSIELKEGI